MMEPTVVVRKPLVTEKSAFASGEVNRYSFLVDPRASKPQIKKAVEALYRVRVLGVWTQTRPGKLRRTRTGYVRTSPTKRAIVRIHADDRIELF